LPILVILNITIVYYAFSSGIFQSTPAALNTNSLAEKTTGFALSAVQLSEVQNPLASSEVVEAAENSNKTEAKSKRMRFTAKQAGTFQITASTDMIKDTVTVTVKPGELAKVRVLPRTASVKAGETIQFRAVGFDKHGNEISGIESQWEITPNLGEITQKGLFTGKRIGKGIVTVHCSLGSKLVSATAEVEVTLAKLVKITIMPAEPLTLRAGESQEFVAIGEDIYGNKAPVPVSWSIADKTKQKATGPLRYVVIKNIPEDATVSVLRNRPLLQQAAPQAPDLIMKLSEARENQLFTLELTEQRDWRNWYSANLRIPSVKENELVTIRVERGPAYYPWSYAVRPGNKDNPAEVEAKWRPRD